MNIICHRWYRKSVCKIYNVCNKTLSSEVKEWLLQKGINMNVADGVIKAFPGGKVSIGEVKSLDRKSVV